MSKQIPELPIITTPTAGQESLIETVVARHDTYTTSRMTLAQIFTLGSISGSIKVALDALSGLISGNTSSINTLSSTKLNIAWGTRTGLTAKAVVATDASGNEVLITGTLWQQIGFDVSNTPVAITPTVDVHGLTQKTTPVWGDYTIITDSEASFVNKKIDLKTLMQDIGGNGSDGALTISTGTTTIPFTADWVVEKNYTTLTITGWTLNFSWPLSNGSIAVIRCHKFVMSGGVLTATGMWWATATRWYNAVKTLTTNAWVTYSPSTGGAWAGDQWDLTKYCWAGGWNWKQYSNQVSWLGWRGGWILIIQARSFDFTGWTISANWANGGQWTNWSGTWGSWGGGGGGGMILIYTRNIVNNTWTIQVNWWNGWNAAAAGGGWYYDSAESWGGGGWYSSGGTGGNNFGNGNAWTSNAWWTWGTGWTGSVNVWSWGGGGWAWYYKVN